MAQLPEPDICNGSHLNHSYLLGYSSPSTWPTQCCVAQSTWVLELMKSSNNMFLVQIEHHCLLSLVSILFSCPCHRKRKQNDWITVSISILYQSLDLHIIEKWFVKNVFFYSTNKQHTFLAFCSRPSRSTRACVWSMGIGTISTICTGVDGSVNPNVTHAYAHNIRSQDWIWLAYGSEGECNFGPCLLVSCVSDDSMRESVMCAVAIMTDAPTSLRPGRMHERHRGPCGVVVYLACNGSRTREARSKCKDQCYRVKNAIPSRMYSQMWNIERIHQVKQ